MDIRRKRSIGTIYCYAVIVYSGLLLVGKLLFRKDEQ